MTDRAATMAMQYGPPMTGLGDPNAPKAPQACLSCRKQKRKCNKGLPACSLCERMGRPCDYSNTSPAPTSEDFNALRQKLMELETRLNGNNGANDISNGPYMTPSSTNPLTGPSENVGSASGAVYFQQDPAFTNIQNRFPSIAFLDAEACRYGGIGVPTPGINIPVEVVEILGDGSAVQAVINDYFDTVHAWLPIISKKRMTRNMLNPLWEAGPDLALVFLCMKLMITRPQDGLENNQNPIYTSAKRFLALQEACGMTSLLVLQANILISTYEIGQAIYPAAWMSVGACVRYGQLLGINGHEGVPQLLGRAETWTEVEERKRTWWGVIILDRVVSVGSKGRSLASEDPSKDAELPSDTIVWDQEEMAHTALFVALSSFSEKVCSFSRLCQAVYLLGKVERHHLYATEPESQQFLDASALYVEISALTRQITQEAESSPDYLSHAAPLAICFSALCVLCNPYACHRPNKTSGTQDVSMQTQAVEGLKTVAASIKVFADQITARTPHSLDIDRISPFIMDSFYCAAANYAWLVRESGDEAFQIGLDSIRHCLRRLGGRWRCAAEAGRLLEAQEFTYAMGGAAAGGGSGPTVV